MGEAGQRRRERAARLQAASMEGTVRRERVLRFAGAAAVAVVVVGIVGVAVLARSLEQGSGPVSRVMADPGAARPAGVLAADAAQPFGVPYGPAAEGSAPLLEIWEDFQCPACGAVEAANGDGIASLAEQGKVRLVWRPTTFLDRNLGSDASARAVAAWGCAIDAGRSREFHDVVYANQPLTEGQGWSPAELVSFGSLAGIAAAELPRFTSCVEDGTYLAWAANSTQEFYDDGIQGTPHAELDGVVLANDVLADPVRLAAAVEQASASR